MTILGVSALSNNLAVQLPAAAQTVKAGVTGFADLMAQLTESGLNTLRTSEQTAMKGIAGIAPTEEVVSAIMSAERNLNTALAVRDKAVSAYLEISRMQL